MAHTNKGPTSMTVNGIVQGLGKAGSASLMVFLRNDLQLNSPKYGCGLGECGACTVLVDGVAARACVIPASGMGGRSITTLEGLGARGNLHPVQQAFIDEQAAQCGYCLSGMVMMATALLLRTADPGDDEIRRELSGNLCRCGAHIEILNAVRRAAVLMQQRAAEGAGK